MPSSLASEPGGGGWPRHDATVACTARSVGRGSARQISEQPERPLGDPFWIPFVDDLDVSRQHLVEGGGT